MGGVLEGWARLGARTYRPRPHLTHSPAHFFRISAAMGTVELTGLEMMFSRAPGQASAAAATRSRTMPRGCEQEWAGGLGRLTEARQAHSCSARPPAPFKPRPDRKCALAGVDLEQVVARHARLARHARGDDDDVAPLEGGVQLVGAGVALKKKKGRGEGWGGRGVSARSLFFCEGRGRASGVAAVRGLAPPWTDPVRVAPMPGVCVQALQAGPGAGGTAKASPAARRPHTPGERAGARPPCH